MTLTDKRIRFNNSVRQIQQKRIKEENNEFFSRLITIPSIINRKKFENDYNLSKLAAMHLRKIERNNITTPRTTSCNK
jgi:hypothetical protein